MEGNKAISFGANPRMNSFARKSIYQILCSRAPAWVSLSELNFSMISRSFSGRSSFSSCAQKLGRPGQTTCQSVKQIGKKAANHQPASQPSQTCIQPVTPIACQSVNQQIVSQQTCQAFCHHHIVTKSHKILRQIYITSWRHVLPMQ